MPSNAIDTCAPPVIVRDKRALTAFGSVTSNYEQEVFSYAADAYGYLVETGEEITGAAWIRRIEQSYDIEEPRNKAVVDVVKRVMMVDRFADDMVVFDGEGVAVYRGNDVDRQAFKTTQVGVSFTEVPVSDLDSSTVGEAMLAMVAADVRSLGGKLQEAPISQPIKPHPYRIDGLRKKWEVVPDSEDSMIARMMSLLDHSPVGAESFSTAEESDSEAQALLLSRLVKFSGYGHVVTYTPPNYKPGAVAKTDSADGWRETAAVEKTLSDFCRSMSDMGWEPTTPVFLTRPTPVIGLDSRVAPFESYVHSKLIGFRLPSAMVHRLAFGDIPPEDTDVAVSRPGQAG